MSGSLGLWDRIIYLAWQAKSFQKSPEVITWASYLVRRSFRWFLWIVRAFRSCKTSECGSPSNELVKFIIHFCQGVAVSVNLIGDMLKIF